ncbi:MAG: Hsp70 family protein [Thermoguttaceae bacterium]|nr:Hsp70 family protein [Thermoguttaceae bacterium]MDW8039109.1 Hsp70 family protein [Thermoguttaceae bacterium]
MGKLKPIGIDLGTTNSAVAWVDHAGRTAMVPNSEGDILTPSVVFFDDYEVIVGKEARAAAILYPDRVAECVKRDMGHPYYSKPIRGQYLPPEVIQACILRKLKADILHTLGPDTAVVITVPAYFDELRRKATADAGEMAGLRVLDIVNEPTAAALSFGEAVGFLTPSGSPKEEMTVMVYDLGGGTFDVTLLHLAPGTIRTIATDGDVQLGGRDWDMRLVDYVAEQFKAIHGLDPRQTPAGLQRLLDTCVEAKHTLSARTKTKVRVVHEGRIADIEVTREKFEELTADLLERTAYTCRQLLAAAKMDWSQINRILLVGGSTRMPMVSRMLKQLSGMEPDHTVNPDEAVARGAAQYASYLLAKQGGIYTRPSFEVVNVNAHSLGVEGIDPDTMRKTNVILIPRNTPLPARFTERFATKTDNQRSIVIQILEGESTHPAECTPIARTVIRDLPTGLPKGWPVEVTFEYGTNGRLSVRAVVPGTQREVQLELERDWGYSSEGIARWRQVMAGSPGFGDFERLLQEMLQTGPSQTAQSVGGGWVAVPVGAESANWATPLGPAPPAPPAATQSSPATASVPTPSIPAPSASVASGGTASIMSGSMMSGAAMAGPSLAGSAAAAASAAVMPPTDIPGLRGPSGLGAPASAARPIGEIAAGAISAGGVAVPTPASLLSGPHPASASSGGLTASYPPQAPPLATSISTKTATELSEDMAGSGSSSRMLSLVGHVIFALLGLALGYLIGHWWNPERFPLPW